LAFSRYMNFLVPFLNNQLKNSCPDGNRFMDSINATSAAVTSKKIQGTLACSNIGIQDTKDELAMSMYPNPVKDNLELSFSSNLLNEKVEISIIDQLGRTILLKKWMQLDAGKINTSIDTREFKAGLYYVKLIVGKTQLMQKLIIE